MRSLFAYHRPRSTDDWYTPSWIFDGLGVTFDLDVCAPPGGPLHVPARAYFDENDDGLTQPWDGLVWCNPPYGKPGDWCRRWANHDAGCLLIKQELSATGPLAAWRASTSCYVPSGRIQFVTPEGATPARVSFPSILLGRGDVADEAIERLAQTYGGVASRLERAT